MFNKNKCRFSLPKVSYIGYTPNPEGVKNADPKKVKAVKDMPPPTDKKDIERELGTISYLAKFIPNMSTITQPIEFKSDVYFHWEEPQQNALTQSKGFS